MCLEDIWNKIGLFLKGEEEDFWPTDGFDLTWLRPLPSGPTVCLSAYLSIFPSTRRTQKPQSRSKSQSALDTILRMIFDSI